MELKTLPAYMHELEALLSVDEKGIASFDDAAWLRANQAYR